METKWKERETKRKRKLSIYISNKEKENKLVSMKVSILVRKEGSNK